MSSRAGSQPDVGVLLVAAGAGVRAGEGEAKQFRPIHGVPLLTRSLEPFMAHPDVCRVVIALPAALLEQPPARVPRWSPPRHDPRVILVAGGATRTESVRAALGSLPTDLAIVLVHDAARPFVSRETIDGVITRARAGVGAVAAVPVSDTIKEVEDGERVRRTVDRSRLWRAQTPQGFPRAMFEEAMRRLDPRAPAPTDDAEICERAGFPVEVVADSVRNFKITTAEDFRLAEALVRESV